MPPELDQMSPGIDGPEPQQQLDTTPANVERDHEGAMAKADLYKLANYSHKLFQQIDDNDQLEGWVQAKITKAADYIASVYHYLEYEMKFSEYGKQLDDSDVLSEGQKRVLKNRLMEAKGKIKELKKAQVEKSKEDKAEKVDENAFDYKDKSEMKTGDSKKTRTGVMTKTATGVKHVNTSHSDEERGEANTTHAKAKSAGEKKAEAPALKKSKSGTWGMEGGKKFDTRKTNEGARPDYIDADNDGDEKESMKQAFADKKKAPFKKVKEALKGDQKKLDVDNDDDIEADDLADLRAGKKKKVAEGSKEKCNHTDKGEKCPVHGLKECGMYEAAPSAGLSKAKKSATVKDAKAGKDIGKPGKGFDKLAKKTNPKIAAAAMWKNVKETTKAEMEEGSIQGGVWTSAPPKKGEKDVPPPQNDDQGTLKSAPKKPVKKAEVETDTAVAEGLNESADFNRMKEFLTRLNG